MSSPVFRLERDDVTPALQNTFGALSGFSHRRVLYAMAATFKRITLENFGDSGVDRPSAWAPLSAKYSKRVGRNHATLDLNGRLFRSIGMTVGQDFAEVFSDGLPYNEVHQFGNSKTPARPYFPVDSSGNLTAYSEQRMADAANREIQAIFDRKPSAVIV